MSDDHQATAPDDPTDAPGGGDSAARRRRRIWLLSGGGAAVVAIAVVVVLAMTGAFGAPTADATPSPTATPAPSASASPTPSPSTAPAAQCTPSGETDADPRLVGDLPATPRQTVVTRFDSASRGTPTSFRDIGPGRVLIERSPENAGRTFTMFDVASRAQLWTMSFERTQSVFLAGTRASTGEAVVLFGARDATRSWLVSVDETSGAQLARVDLPPFVVTVPQVMNNPWLTAQPNIGVALVDLGDELRAVDPRTLAARWSVALPADPGGIERESPIVSGSVLQVGRNVYDARTGQQLPWPDSIGSLLESSQGGVLAVDASTVSGVDVADGRPCWTIPETSGGLGAIDRTFVVKADGTLLDVSVETGAVRETWGRIDPAAPRTLLSGRFTTQSSTGWLVYDTPGSTPTAIGSMDPNGRTRQVVGYDSQRVFLLNDGRGNPFEAIDLATGRTTWAGTSPQIWTADGDTVGVAGGHIFVVRRINPGNQWPGGPLPVGPDGSDVVFMLE